MNHPACIGRLDRRVLLLAPIAALALAPRAVAAQVRDTMLGNRLLSQRTLRPPFTDSVVVALVKHGSYHIAVWPGGTLVQIRPQVRDAGNGFAPRVREGTGESATAIEFIALDNAAHVITVAPPAGTSTVQLWIWQDTEAERSATRRREGHMGIGLELHVGITSGYSIGELAPASAAPSVEGGVLVGSSGRFSMLLGFGSDPRSRGVESVNWVFAEPRFRIQTWTLSSRDLDLHGAIRYAQGNSTTIVEDPSLIAVGLLLDWHLTDRHGARGVNAGVEGTYGLLRNSTARNRRLARLALTISWMP